MSLYLCVLVPDTDEELEGIEVSPYSYFGAIRDSISGVLGNSALEAFPLFLSHSDCDGEWSVGDLPKLTLEIQDIQLRLSQYGPRPISDVPWYLEYYKAAAPSSLARCMFDVDGEDLFDRFLGMCLIARDADLPILFQ